MLIDQAAQITISFRILIAFFAGILIGIDREKSGKVAGVRTQMLVCVGSALFSGLSVYVANSLGVLGQDPTRIMAQIVSGVGFLGAGVILKKRGRLSGVTTAATIWATAAVGTAFGCGFYIPGIVLTVLILMLNPIAYLQYKFGTKGMIYVLSFNKTHENEVKNILEEQRIKILKKSILKVDTHLHLLSTEQKNDKLVELLNGKTIKFTLDVSED